MAVHGATDTCIVLHDSRDGAPASAEVVRLILSARDKRKCCYHYRMKKFKEEERAEQLEFDP